MGLYCTKNLFKNHCLGAFYFSFGFAAPGLRKKAENFLLEPVDKVQVKSVDEVQVFMDFRTVCDSDFKS
jgi:hypothetical protein